MILRKPAFFDDFICIADKCSDNCCIGWEIDVDDKMQEKYRKIANTCSDAKRKEYAKELLKNIEDGHFILNANGRCPFLKENGLCSTIQTLGVNGTDKDPDGETILCDICREHPRFVEVYGDIMEKGIGLCCEEGARLLLTTSRLPLVESEIDDKPDEMPEGAEEARDAIFAERDYIFELLSNTAKPLNRRLIDVLDYAESTAFVDESEVTHKKSSPDIGAIFKTWLKVLGEGESYGPAWDAAYKQMQKHFATSQGFPTSEDLFSDEDGARIVAYHIFRYYAKSLFDGDSLSKVQFAIFFWIILKFFGEELSKLDGFNKICNPDSILSSKLNAIKLLSKQQEYSDEIMEILAKHFCEDEHFSVNVFRKVLEQA